MAGTVVVDNITTGTGATVQYNAGANLDTKYFHVTIFR